jgi:hypothetical protein
MLLISPSFIKKKKDVKVMRIRIVELVELVKQEEH